METPEAFSIIVQAVHSVQATADVHNKIQEALLHIQQELQPKKEVPKKK